MLQIFDLLSKKGSKGLDRRQSSLGLQIASQIALTPCVFQRPTQLLQLFGRARCALADEGALEE